jgi:2-iminobutanoate/2-iminopropanoate deaminase
MEKTVIRTEAAPAPFQGAPYNQAIVAGDFVFVAGQVGLAPGAAAIEGDIAQQTDQALKNLGAILEAAGSSMQKLVKTSVFLQRLDDFQAMNEVYASHVGSTPPARSTFEVAKLPAGAVVEIEAIAHL